MSDAAAEAVQAETDFGSCCSELREALAAEDFEPLITVGPDDVLYLSVGMVELADKEPGIVDHPIFFCPFCGTKLQSPDQVKSKVAQEAASAAAEPAP
jgi:hypothetical protein